MFVSQCCSLFAFSWRVVKRFVSCVAICQRAQTVPEGLCYGSFTAEFAVAGAGGCATWRRRGVRCLCSVGEVVRVAVPTVAGVVVVSGDLRPAADSGGRARRCDEPSCRCGDSACSRGRLGLALPHVRRTSLARSFHTVLATGHPGAGVVAGDLAADHSIPDFGNRGGGGV